jgi:multiple sugar transport system permease protein
MSQKKSVLWTTEARLAYLVLFPSIAVLTLFMFYPILYVFLMAFFKTNKLGNIVKFIGVGNFLFLFKNKAFWEVTLRSILWTVIAVTSKTVTGLIIALLLNVEFVGRRLSRTLVIIPWASSVPVSAMLWQWTYNSEFGLLNYTLKATGLWDLAGLQAIPKHIYESAEVDGASAWVRFWYITLPMLKRVLLIATLLSSLWTFNDFNVIYILTKGGPVNKTDILITFIYKYSFQFLKFGPAAAMAVITFIILLVVSLIYARFYFRSIEL